MLELRKGVFVKTNTDARGLEVRTIVIAHLYPRDMSIYGDLGNVIALSKRLEWRGYKPVVRPVEMGTNLRYRCR